MPEINEGIRMMVIGMSLVFGVLVLLMIIMLVLGRVFQDSGPGRDVSSDAGVSPPGTEDRNIDVSARPLSEDSMTGPNSELNSRGVQPKGAEVLDRKSSPLRSAVKRRAAVAGVTAYLNEENRILATQSRSSRQINPWKLAGRQQLMASASGQTSRGKRGYE